MHVLLSIFITAHLHTSVPPYVAIEHETDQVLVADSIAAADTVLLPFRQEIEQAAAQYHLPPALIAAVIQEESRFDPWATRAEPRYIANAKVRSSAAQWSAAHQGLPTTLTEILDRSRSYGLMQVLGETAREQGYRSRYLATLYAPSHSIAQGAQLLRRLLARYGLDTLSAISAYNQGTARRRTRDGLYLNARYVYRVAVAWRAYTRWFEAVGRRPGVEQHD